MFIPLDTLMCLFIVMLLDPLCCCNNVNVPGVGWIKVYLILCVLKWKLKHLLRACGTKRRSRLRHIHIQTCYGNTLLFLWASPGADWHVQLEVLAKTDRLITGRHVWSLTHCWSLYKGHRRLSYTVCGLHHSMLCLTRDFKKCCTVGKIITLHFWSF